MSNNNDILTLQVTTGIAAVVTMVMPVISAAFMIVSVATGCITIYKFFKKK
jgi:hypothetical protein